MKMVVLGGNIAMMSAADQSPNVIKVDEQDHYHGNLTRGKHFYDRKSE